MKGLLIDSDIVIDYLRGLNNSEEFLVSASRNYRLYLSVITICEVYSGKETKNFERRKEIDKFLNNFQISLVTPSIAKLAGELRRDYSRPFADMLVASSALLYNFILATRNTKHFKNITNLKILKPY